MAEPVKEDFGSEPVKEDFSYLPLPDRFAHKVRKLLGMFYVVMAHGLNHPCRIGRFERKATKLLQRSSEIHRTSHIRCSSRLCKIQACSKGLLQTRTLQHSKKASMLCVRS